MSGSRVLPLTRAEIDLSPLDLDLTLGCGQTFRWRRRADGSWSGPLGKDIITLKGSGRKLLVDGKGDGSHLAAAVRTYLRAGDDVGAIQRALGKDPVLSPGIHGLRGLRIVKMDEWECLVSYVLATYANIPRIARMIDALSRRYGTPIDGDTYSFPAPKAVRRATVAELRRCGLGYRAKYVRAVGQAVNEDRIRELRRRRYPELREELKSLPGVGDKVADCVCLFGFGRLEAFPIDVWMERALARLYGQTGSYAKLRTFAASRFGRHAGYAQEYMYHNERTRARGGACAFSEQAQD
ncbi:MAG: hypothetical protein A3K67_07460 [Euryarchaeota archaeon RBG_16_62_10]|nr:MAG: hypothetical protein A3K67_07460 [Euryarchaeota archaeon RBG_16_62_10]